MAKTLFLLSEIRGTYFTISIIFLKSFKTTSSDSEITFFIFSFSRIYFKFILQIKRREKPHFTTVFPFFNPEKIIFLTRDASDEKNSEKKKKKAFVEF